MKSRIHIPPHSDFPLENIPFGVAEHQGQTYVATRVGDTVVKLLPFATAGLLGPTLVKKSHIFQAQVLNPFIELGKPTTTALRHRLQELLSEESTDLDAHPEIIDTCCVPLEEVRMLMPVAVGDYTDFYSSIEHATNVGIMFRDPANALLPNWKHLPVGYHGRSSSIVVSGTNIHRPKGQTKPKEDGPVVFGSSQQLDFELEMAFITVGSTNLGESIPVEQAEDHIFGLVLFNDLSARDIQKWEYVPLGPFLSKSFGSVISPWVVTLEALEPFRVAGPLQEPEPLPYLKQQADANFDIQLQVLLKPASAGATIISQSNFRYMYWSMRQQLAHQTVAGCNIRTGDMYGSGTISGPTPGSYGSMLELCWKGTKPLRMADGSERIFLHDNDTVIMTGFAQNNKLRIGFGSCETTILPALT